MQISGPGNFENDEAASFIADQVAVSDLGPALGAIAASNIDGRIELEAGARALAAAEAIAAAAGSPSPDAPGPLVSWAGDLPAPPSDADLDTARGVIPAVMSDDSALCEHWSSTAFVAWQAELSALQARLA
jgi:hypothetical protein